MPEMPLAVTRGGVVVLLDQFCDGHLVCTDTMPRCWAKSTVDADSVRVATGQQCGSRCRTHGLSGVEVGEGSSFLRHAIQMRRRDLAIEWSDVGVAKIVAEDDDDVGPIGLVGDRVWADDACQEREVKKASHGVGPAEFGEPNDGRVEKPSQAVRRNVASHRWDPGHSRKIATRTVTTPAVSFSASTAFSTNSVIPSV